MKKRNVDGIEYEQIDWGVAFANLSESIIHLRPLPTPQKTLVQVAADVMDWSEAFYRKETPYLSAVFDEIERRLQALEAKGK